jgi:hypothetical protein
VNIGVLIGAEVAIEFKRLVYLVEEKFAGGEKRDWY